ncbi:MAG: outer membrane lipoprotein LolB [Proteobacteria bacterium]|nr:outer membrane lipoprotein LolB [Pseudomonadota bacterium]
MKQLAAALAAALLSACATLPPMAPGEGWQGRLAVRVAATEAQPAESFSASFELRGDGDAGELVLTTPLGTRAGVARWSPAGAELDDGQGARRYATLDALARDVFKQDLPLAALPSWLAGRPWPAAPALATGQGFDQLGWAVDLTRHAEGELRATRAAPPALSLSVRLDRP